MVGHFVAGIARPPSDGIELFFVAARPNPSPPRTGNSRLFPRDGDEWVQCFLELVNVGALEIDLVRDAIDHELDRAASILTGDKGAVDIVSDGFDHLPRHISSLSNATSAEIVLHIRHRD